MPDPIDTTKLSDPQAMVDDALSAPTPAPAPTPVVTPPPGDETPLAFSAPSAPPVPTPPVDTAPEPSIAPPPVAPAEPPTTTPPVMPDLTPPPSSEMPSALPPVAPAPVQVEDKPKKKSKVMMVVLGVFALLGGLGATGYYAYQQYFGASNTVAPVSGYNQDNCDGECDQGHLLKWKNGACVWTDKSCGGESTTTDTSLNTKAKCEANGSGDPGFWCTGCGGFCNTSKDQGCYQLQADKCGEGQPLGGSFSATKDSKFFKECSCYGTKYYFDKTGYCGGGDTSDPAGLSTETLKTGLCAITPSAPTDDGIADHINDGPAGITTYYYCPGMVSDVSAGCQVSGTPPPNPNCYCGTIQEDTPGEGFKSVTMKCGCGTTENPKHSVCDTVTKACKVVDGAGTDSCATDADCAGTAMSCTGLTRTPTTESPTIGQTLTFTCAGSITPSTAGTLSYKFRYNINSGANTTLANKTATTAELTIAACGTYSVECQACATIAGVLTCDPVWTGATQ